MIGLRYLYACQILAILTVLAAIVLLSVLSVVVACSVKRMIEYDSFQSLAGGWPALGASVCGSIDASR